MVQATQPWKQDSVIRNSNWIIIILILKFDLAELKSLLHNDTRNGKLKFHENVNSTDKVPGNFKNILRRNELSPCTSQVMFS